MSRFKIKPNKKRNTKKTVDVKNVTLDKKYNEKIRSIDENNNKFRSAIVLLRQKNDDLPYTICTFKNIDTFLKKSIDLSRNLKKSNDFLCNPMIFLRNHRFLKKAFDRLPILAETLAKKLRNGLRRDSHFLKAYFLNCWGECMLSSPPSKWTPSVLP